MNLSLVRSALERNEGRVKHLYLCSTGHITVARGHRVFSVQEALKLPLYPRETIIGDWEAVLASKPGMLPRYYAAITKARMSDADIDLLTDADIARFEAQLRKRLPKWDSYPDPAQRAIFDLVYNVGIGMLVPSSEAYWPKLNAALKAEDWALCAANCHRKPPISEERNQETAALFFEAAKSGGTAMT